MTSSHRTQLTRAVLGAGLATALSGGILGVGTAAAATFTKPDATGDVVSATAGGTTTSPAPDQVDGDVTTIKSVHSHTNVAVKITFADLTKTNDGRLDYMRIATSANKEWKVFGQAGPGQWAGKGYLETPAGNTSGCHIGYVSDYTANTVTITVPRKCVGNPTWVKLGYGAQTQDGSTLFIDDARRTGYPSEADDVLLGGKTNHS